MLDCPCKLLIGRAFLGEFPETVLSQSPELLGKGWLAVEVNLKKIPPVRILACISHGGRTISTAFVLTESVGVDLVEDVADSAGKSLLLDGERTVVAIDLKDGCQRSLHLLVEDIHDLALDKLRLHISPFGGFLALWKRSDIFLYQRFEGVKIDITDNHHCGTGSIGEEPAIVLLDGLEVDLLKFLHRKHLISWVVVVENLVESLLESEVRCVHEIRKNGLDLGDGVVKFLLIEARLHKLKVEKLERCLKILHGRVSGDSVIKIIYERTDTHHLSGKHLGKFCSLEF